PAAGLAAEARRRAAPRVTIADSLAGSALAAEIAPWVDELTGHAAEGILAARALRGMERAVPGADERPGRAGEGIRAGRVLRGMKPAFTELDVGATAVTGRVAPPNPMLP